MNNHLVASKNPLSGIVRIGIAMAIALLLSGIFYLSQVHDPYIQTVLSLNGDIQRGHEIFEINCAACHGVQADGNVGPSLQHIPQRKSRVRLIYQVTSGKTPPMPKFQPTTQDMADLLSYLENL